jgi:hypothetical protein
MPKKREVGKEGKILSMGILLLYVDGVCEGVYASNVLVHTDSDSDGL